MFSVMWAIGPSVVGKWIAGTASGVGFEYTTMSSTGHVLSWAMCFHTPIDSSQAMFSEVKLLILFSHVPSPVHDLTLSRLPPSNRRMREVALREG